MSILGFLIPLALLMGLVGLGAFFWAMKSGQFEDLDGAAANPDLRASGLIDRNELSHRLSDQAFHVDLSP